jgi:hypothetical protein
VTLITLPGSRIINLDNVTIVHDQCSGSQHQVTVEFVHGHSLTLQGIQALEFLDFCKSEAISSPAAKKP